LEAAVSRRKKWSRERADTYDLRLIVRCQGRRFLGVGIGEPAPMIALDEAIRLPSRRDEKGEYQPDAGRFTNRPWRFHKEFLVGATFDNSRDTSTYPCPNHRGGHQIDGERLRGVIYRLCRPGKIANVDVRTVERVAAASS
jgi:hypothetical protein